MNTNEWLVPFFSFESFPLVLAKEKLPFTAFKSTEIDFTVTGYILAALALAAAVTYVANYYYYKWKKFKDFEFEMQALDLDPASEDTLAGMVKRYSMDEPINILFSERLFDKMATKEIMRVLGSPASIKSKQKFVDTIYTIRTRTCHPEWLAETTKGNPSHSTQNTPLTEKP